MCKWKPISEADTSKVYIALCIHEEDDYYDKDRKHCLTSYGASAEGDHVPNGLCLICYRETYQDSDGWEQPTYTMPGCWIHYCGYDDPEKAANPVFFLDIDLCIPELIKKLETAVLRNVCSKVIDSIISSLPKDENITLSVKIKNIDISKMVLK